MSKSTKRNNKTSHVLNLLTNRTGIPEEELIEAAPESAQLQPAPQAQTQAQAETQPAYEQPVPQQQPAQPAPQAQTQAQAETQPAYQQPVPQQPVQAEAKPEAAVSDQIKAGLEKAMDNLTINGFVPEKFDLSEEVPLSQQTGKGTAIKGDEMPMQREGQYYYINILEEIVKNEALEIMRKMNMCMCDKCINDVIAFALNSLPPRYVVSQKTSLYVKIAAYEKQYSADILAAVTKACIQVKNIPRH